MRRLWKRDSFAHSHVFPTKEQPFAIQVTHIARASLINKHPLDDLARPAPPSRAHSFVANYRRSGASREN